MAKVRGLTLLEIMMAMAISLFLLSAFMVVWVAMSKSSHKELKVFEKNQDYIEAVSYLRYVIGRAIYRPHCPNIEWLSYRVELKDQFIGRIVDGMAHPVVLYSFLDIVGGVNGTLIDDLAMHASKLLRDSNVVEIVHFTPLSITEDSQIINVEDIKGTQEGYVLATDCRQYVIGRYQRNKRNDLVLVESLVNDINNHLGNRYSVQYYKINRELLYVINNSGNDQLVHNFLDGSNHMRLYGVGSLEVSFADELDRQLLSFKIAEEKFYIRLYNL